MSSSACRTKSNIRSWFRFVPSRQHKHKLRIPLGRLLGALGVSLLRRFLLLLVALQRGNGQEQVAIPSPRPSSSASSEGAWHLSDGGRKHSAGVVGSTSPRSSVVPPSLFDESQSNRVNSESECGEEEEEGVKERRGTGGNPKLFTYFVHCGKRAPAVDFSATSIASLQPGAISLGTVPNAQLHLSPPLGTRTRDQTPMRTVGRVHGRRGPGLLGVARCSFLLLPPHLLCSEQAPSPAAGSARASRTGTMRSGL